MNLKKTVFCDFFEDFFQKESKNAHLKPMLSLHEVVFDR